MQHAAGAAAVAGAGATTTARTHQQAGYVLRATCSTVAATTETKTQHSSLPLSLSSLSVAQSRLQLSKLVQIDIFFSPSPPCCLSLSLSSLLVDQPGVPHGRQPVAGAAREGRSLDFEMQTRHLILLSPQFNYLFGGKCHVQCQQRCNAAAPSPLSPLPS